MKLALWNIHFSYQHLRQEWRHSGSIDVLAPTCSRAIAVVEAQTARWPEVVIHSAQKRTATDEILFDPAITVTFEEA